MLQAGGQALDKRGCGQPERVLRRARILRQQTGSHGSLLIPLAKRRSRYNP